MSRTNLDEDARAVVVAADEAVVDGLAHLFAVFVQHARHGILEIVKVERLQLGRHHARRVA